jgi:hypothetical protein
MNFIVRLLFTSYGTDLQNSDGDLECLSYYNNLQHSHRMPFETALKLMKRMQCLYPKEKLLIEPAP